MTETTAIDPAIVACVERALTQDTISPWFQPAMDAAGVTMLNVEALPRLDDPEMGIVAPDTFLAAAKAHGLLASVGEVLLRKTCEAYAVWEARGIAPPQVSINLTGDELRTPGLAERLRTALEGAGVQPGGFGVEVTEDVVVGDVAEASLDAITALHGLGVSVIIDDIGSCEVTLAALKALGASSSKISRAMVAAIDEDPDAAGRLEPIVETCRALGCPVIAKGVETRNQIDVLTALGCEGQQGYAIARPMPLDSFTEWLDLNTGWDMSDAG